MKYFLSLVFILAIAPKAALAAVNDEDPTRFCSSAGECSAPMEKIVKNYSQAGVPFVRSALDAFSGACYHLDPSYDPNYTHYGAFVFQNQSAVLSVAGLFSFFYSEDPYKGMSSVEVEKHVLDGGSAMKPVVMNKDSVELTFIASSSDTRYWFRGVNDRLYVIGRQASAGSSPTLVFCEMIRH